ncbi:4-(cytidine 5'-diphospho)-2-C-methyl-D-erythritol kinase [Caenimonas soli]|jgi:4-diphosphocytidyl-2-C-methyl-D-erythritol kinase|uniref:4-(cytidine 5'-diphospho)-2-C-methyl-D-erythritol kinase n=1 Tax=Caenimonas soli TaxID=2735555 RepID=UPI0015573AB2|nr:4-(cytidine 5'-diphospho)-2-C-methyl-D-erythritol kinase [Caenimonas soli]NPC57660.1 4-(cytidine 5'-diphospho)-2-C-methyl-D-erythritol kinase [Caenimonas soli]
MKALYDVPAPAKLNLFLHVTGRRPDGMHLLQSAFMLIDWCDTLHFELRPGGGLSREDLGDALPADDLVLRAARALQQASATGHGAHIAIEKRLPSQAGMGGGSSDAASCLLALNRLWGLNYPLARLTEIGLSLGADVPFFLGGRNAWVEGVGELLSPIALPRARFVVAKPPEGLETAGIFKDPLLKRCSEPAIISGFAANPYAFGVNDLQPVAQRLCPGVTQALQWLGSQGLQGRMTGSGSAVFAQITGAKPLQAAPVGWQVRECGNLEAHPLLGWAPSDDSSVGG